MKGHVTIRGLIDSNGKLFSPEILASEPPACGTRLVGLGQGALSGRRAEPGRHTGTRRESLQHRGEITNPGLAGIFHYCCLQSL